MVNSGLWTRRDALVAEVLADLVDAVETAHQQSLQIQFGSDAQVEVAIQRVVMGRKGTSESAAGQGLEDRGLHLHEALGVQIAAHGRHQLAPRPQLPGDVGIAHQVDVALPVPGLAVLEPVKLLGQGPQGLGEHGPGRGEESQFAPPGAEDMPLATNDVAHVHIGEQRKGLLAHRVHVAVDLDVVPAVPKGQEDGLAVLPAGHDPAGHPIVALLVLPACLELGMSLEDLGGVGAGCEAARVGFDVLPAQALDLGQAVTLPFSQMGRACAALFLLIRRSGSGVHLGHLSDGEDLVAERADRHVDGHHFAHLFAQDGLADRRFVG